MPVISTFFGIMIRMFFGDHPPPHFHAEYQGEKATFAFNGDLLAGNISSPRVSSADSRVGFASSI